MIATDACMEEVERSRPCVAQHDVAANGIHQRLDVRGSISLDIDDLSFFQRIRFVQPPNWFITVKVPMCQTRRRKD